MTTPHWAPEHDDDLNDGMWYPTLYIDGCAFSFEAWFTTAAECQAFIDTIPAGTP